MSLVTTDTTEGVRTITISRADAHNSLNSVLRRELRAAFESAAADCSTDVPVADRVRAVVLTADGAAFCTGQDLREQLADMKAGTGQDKVTGEYNPMVKALLSIPVPVIAAVNGPAAGAGWAIAMACDFRIVADTASFKGAFTGVGLASDCGLSRSLADTVGATRALEMLLTDEKIPAAEATDFVTEVVPAGELAERVGGLARRLAAGPTASYREIKALVKDPEAVLAAADREAAAQERLSRTADHREAIEAFLAKRAPQFTGE